MFIINQFVTIKTQDLDKLKNPLSKLNYNKFIKFKYKKNYTICQEPTELDMLRSRVRYIQCKA